jgi:hypothetical protein
MTGAAPSEKPRGGVLRFLWRRSIPLDIIQGLFVGYGLALLLSWLLIRAQVRAIMTNVNGWETTQACGVPGAWLVQAACAAHLPAVNAPKEAVYWEATVDARGAKLDGARAYVIHFAAGGLPPANAFWSITIADSHRLMAQNAAHKYSVSDRSGLQTNSDGSVDVYLQPAAPKGHEPNWLPTPSGNFMLWLRAYGPGPAVLDGTWKPPAVTEVPP